MSGVQNAHGALKAKVLAALANGPLSSGDLATAIGYEDGRALVRTLEFHSRQGTLARGPRSGRMVTWGLPGAFKEIPFEVMNPKLAKAIALLRANGYTVTRADDQVRSTTLALPPAERPLEVRAPPKPGADGESIDDYLAKGGQVEVLPAAGFVPATVRPAFPGTR